MTLTSITTYSAIAEDIYPLICLCFHYYRANTERRQRQRNVYKCVLCPSYHSLRFCHKFQAMDSQKRNRVVLKYEYCVNCLAKSHTLRRCRSSNTCQKCQHYHHTLLHPVTRPRITPPIRQHQNSRPQKGTTRASKKPVPTTEPDRHIPNQQILSEAIKSLATVLCATQAPASIPSRRHV